MQYDIIINTGKVDAQHAMHEQPNIYSSCKV